MREKHVPREIRLTKPRENHIRKILSGVPLTSPEITIGPYEGEPFSVTVRGTLEDSVPLEPSAEGFYADYDTANGNLLEATVVRATRRVRVEGVWHVEVYETGCGATDSRLDYPNYYTGWCWHSRHFCRLAPHVITRRHEFSGTPRYTQPRILEPSDLLRWTDEHSAVGPESGEGIFAGYNTVSIGGRAFECIRTLSVQLDEEPEEEPDDELDEESSYPEIVESFCSRQGGTVLVRKYSPKLHDWTRFPETNEGAEIAESRGRLFYNGQEFREWFHMLTAASLASAA